MSAGTAPAGSTGPGRRAWPISADFLDDMWAGALDTARRLVEAEQGMDQDERAAAG